MNCEKEKKKKGGVGRRGRNQSSYRMQIFQAFYFQMGEVCFFFISAAIGEARRHFGSGSSGSAEITVVREGMGRPGGGRISPSKKRREEREEEKLQPVVMRRRWGRRGEGEGGARLNANCS